MKRLAFILIASVLLALATVGGMAVLGMNVAGMHMDAETAGIDCIDHCLGVVSSASTGVVSATISVFAFVALFALICAAWQPMASQTVPSIVRWREGIGKRYRHRELAVVRIQD